MNINDFNTPDFKPAFAAGMNAADSKYTFYFQNKRISSTLLTAESKIEISKISDRIRTLLKV